MEKTFKSLIEKVAEFHEVFQVGNAKEMTIGNIQLGTLRHDLMKEETEEYLSAVINNDMVEVADALGDQLYILLGTILKHGLQDKIVEVFEEIHRSNMSKLDSMGNPIFRKDGKVLKCRDYFKPDINKILQE